MNTLPALIPRRIVLLTGDQQSVERLMKALVVQLALRGHLRCLVGGNRFDSAYFAYTLAGHASDYYAALENILLARAFTCYQMVELMKNSSRGALPTLVFDLLTTFSDESAPEAEVERLLRECIAHLQHISLNAPVAVSAQEPPNRPHLLRLLQDQVDDTLTLAAERSEKPLQPSLFGGF